MAMLGRWRTSLLCCKTQRRYVVDIDVVCYRELTSLVSTTVHLRRSLRPAVSHLEAVRSGTARPTFCNSRSTSNNTFHRTIISTRCTIAAWMIGSSQTAWSRGLDLRPLGPGAGSRAASSSTSSSTTLFISTHACSSSSSSSSSVTLTRSTLPKYPACILSNRQCSGTVACLCNNSNTAGTPHHCLTKTCLEALLNAYLPVSRILAADHLMTRCNTWAALSMVWAVDFKAACMLGKLSSKLASTPSAVVHSAVPVWVASAVVRSFVALPRRTR